MYLNNLCQFPTESEFRKIESQIPEPWVVLVKDIETVFYKELKKSIIKATIDTTSLYNADGVFKDPNNKSVRLCNRSNMLESISIHATNNTSIPDKKILNKSAVPLLKQYSITSDEAKQYNASNIIPGFSNVFNKCTICKYINGSIMTANS